MYTIAVTNKYIYLIPLITQGNLCKHSVGMMIYLGIFEPDRTVTRLPLRWKRGRVRPRKIKRALEFNSDPEVSTIR